MSPPADSPETPSTDADDRALLDQARAGNFAAFQQLVQRLQPRVYGLAIRMLSQHPDAEDATQQTFLSVLENLDSFRGESSVATWVLKIATNHALKALRRRRGHAADQRWDEATEGSQLPHPEFIAPWSEPPDVLVQRAEVRQEIDKALESLDDKYRAVFMLRDIEGLSVRETAAALDLTEAAVKVRLLRARLQLRERLTRAFGDEDQRLTPSHDHR
ncbi:MAG: RNA polymerase sigma factor [Pirellulaceae bacterium]